jgi:hypothetical protein
MAFLLISVFDIKLSYIGLTTPIFSINGLFFGVKNAFSLFFSILQCFLFLHFQTLNGLKCYNSAWK